MSLVSNMEMRLRKAAIDGDVSYLRSLLRDDALLLERWSPCTETPLHIASTLGHLGFVSEFLSQKPDQAMELDVQRSTPLHRAAAKGYLDIVKKLLTVNPEACFVVDVYGRNPLHVAAIRGKADVLKEMARARPQAARERMMGNGDGDGDTVLHLCARYKNWEALKVVLEEEVLSDGDLVNSKNSDGNTILHLAAMEKQNKTVEFLLNNTTIDANSRNRKGLTASEIMSLRPPRTEKETTNNDYAFAGIVHEIEPAGENIPSDHHAAANTSTPPTIKKKNNGGEGTNWLLRKRNSLMVVASLLATMAFQAGINPPGGVWQETSKGDGVSAPHKAGFSIMADNYSIWYGSFLICNTTGFVASLSIILLLVSGLPLRRPIFMWILMVIMWVAITSMALTYLISITTFTPELEEITVIYIIGVVVIIFWMALIAVLLLLHTIRLIVRMVKLLMRKIWKKKRNSSPGDSAI